MGGLKWTFDACKAEALKYNTRSEFQRGSVTAYRNALNSKWLEDICNHMKIVQLPKGFWTKEICEGEALKYTNNTDFRKGSTKAYSASIGHKWYKEITSHFEPRTTLFDRFIYSYEFEDNHVYIGLTYSLRKRNEGHKIEGAVFEHSQTTGLKATFKQLIDEPVSPKEAAILEDVFVEDYKNKGWVILNKAKPGALGGTVIKWTKDKCAEIAKQYETRSDFQKANGSSNQSASRNGWLDELCSHMKIFSKPSGFYNLEICLELARQYSSRKEFKKQFHHAHDLTYKNSWNDIVFAHFTEMRRSVKYTLEECIEEAKKCTTKTDFKNRNIKMCGQVYKNKWMEEVSKYLKKDGV